MKFSVRLLSLQDEYTRGITAQTFHTLHAARTTLSNALALEEKYEILITNYLDFERELLDATVRHMTREHISYVDSFDVIHRINVRLVNLLTAARMYVDQVGRHVAACLPEDPQVAAQIKVRCAAEYDGHFEYRFMEALRNYVQHRGVPVHWSSHGAGWTSMDDDGYLEFRTDVACLRATLEEDGAFKPSVLRECGSRVDLKRSARRYVESLSAIHAVARERIAARVDRAREQVASARKRYRAKVGADLVAVLVRGMSKAGNLVEFPLILNWDDIRLKLVQRNQELTNLSRRCVVNTPMRK